MLNDLMAIDWEASDRQHHTPEKGHGRIESRHCTVVDSGGPRRDERCRLPGRRQPDRICEPGFGQ